MSEPRRRVMICLVSLILLFLIIAVAPLAFHSTYRTIEAPARILIAPNVTGSTRADALYDCYIGNTSSKKFHAPTCSYLPDHDQQIAFDSREEAIAAGYSPCGHCRP